MPDEKDEKSVYKAYKMDKLLGGIKHTVVCGLMSVVVSGGFNYFMTSTDDLNRYGYINFEMSLKKSKRSKTFITR